MDSPQDIREETHFGLLCLFWSETLPNSTQRIEPKGVLTYGNLFVSGGKSFPNVYWIGDFQLSGLPKVELVVTNAPVFNKLVSSGHAVPGSLVLVWQLDCTL